MKNSLYIYQNGELKRHDDTLQFITSEGKSDISLSIVFQRFIALGKIP